ncbi:uncharacterized protein KD926_008000 [Aspergillus affinis]|uniref:uncharacterized protein n=1 Tax=Aspergillus affinis TaxID=1070780 RepID=UPI0022FEC2B1|nr:uncharacterized protein KD926_008000 [Aspergillus affinis]KAI9045584.1 hypothetical protein KD926_008000 [Aspergillus affinis]
MQCLRHVPYASWRLTVYRQIFPSPHPNTLSFSPRRTISSTTTQSQAQQHHQDATHAEQPNNDSPDTPTPRPSDQLPQSPLLTHPHINPVKKHKKRPPTAEDLNRLRKNPWAQALASPIRMCTITAARSPRDLLTTWGLVQRPNSKGLWIMPVDLLKDELSGLESPKGQKPAPPTESSQEPQDSGSGSSPSRALQHLSVRVIDSIQLMRRLCRAMASHSIGYYSGLMKAIPYRYKHPIGPLTPSHARQLVWRQDMPTFVLKRMRVEAAKRLLKTTGQKRSKLGHQSGVWQAVEIEAQVSEETLKKGLEGMKAFERMECGAVIVMKEQEIDKDALPQLVTLPQTGSRVPVFDLSVLLSESDREALRSADPKFQKTGLFFRPEDLKEYNAFMALWKLQGYLNEDAQFGDAHKVD